MAICSKNVALCCLILSIWGVIQLGLMGLFFYLNSPAFAEDIAAEFGETPEGESLSDKIKRLDKFYEDLDDAYQANAINCWIAAAMYVFVALLAAQQVRANNRIVK